MAPERDSFYPAVGMSIELIRNAYYRLPVGLRNAGLVRRLAPIWVETGIIFIHIPRAAGSSVDHALYGRFMGHARALDIRRWGSRQVNALPTFAVTRNPWDRLVSAYRFAKRGSGLGGVYEAGVWRRAQYDVPEFDTFATFVNDWLACRSVRHLDPVFQPQSAFVCDRDGKILVDHIGRYEKLGEIEMFVRNYVPTSESFKRSNRSGASVDYRHWYTGSLAETVGRIYCDDVTRFGYSFEGFSY